MLETDSALSSFPLCFPDRHRLYPSPSRISDFSSLTLRRVIAFTNRGIDRSRCIHEGSFYGAGYPINTNLHYVSRYTQRRGRIDLGDRSRENSEYRLCSHTSSHFDKDHSNVICNTSSVLAPQNIKLEKKR